MTIFWILAFLLIIASAILIIRRHKRGAGKLLLLFLCALLTLLCGEMAYFSVYYSASPEARAELPETELRLGSVRVWLFDGPGEDTALIFYPGAKVEAAAYAPLMAKIADGGTDCFLVDMPLNFPIFGVNAADEIIGRDEYERYVLAGHSLGGVMAASYAAAHPDAVAGLVLLAAFPTKELRTLPMLTVYGDRDGVLNRESLENSRTIWPAGAEELVIPGGNHAQFGSYGPQRGDGEAAITADEQQTQTARAILDRICAHLTETAAFPAAEGLCLRLVAARSAGKCQPAVKGLHAEAEMSAKIMHPFH